MKSWSLTLHGPAGILSSVEAGESQFVIGTETAGDVFTVTGEGVASRHAWVWIAEAGIQVEGLAGETLVNGYAIHERVQVEYPASVQVGELTLVVEERSTASMSVTIPQRVPARGGANERSARATEVASARALSDYKLVCEIARGGMGQIYFSEEAQLNRQVAVKVSSVSEGGEDARFSKEAQVLARLAHPNIVPIYNIGVDAQNRPFYSMKLIKGRTLQAVLNLICDGDSPTIREYPRTALLTIFRKVCDAMMFAHSKSILHRDLKPENIMVGEYGEVLVMDWGLAKVLGERDESVSNAARENDTGDYGMTMEGEVMGTPQYMSPEQAEGMVAELDQRSDIYSLGGILYALLTLRPPIEGATLNEVLTKVKNGSISAMATKRGIAGASNAGSSALMGVEVPEALQAVTLKAMATDRSKRYASVDALASDIERYQNGFATSAEAAGALKKMRLWVGRNKVLATASVVLVVVVSGFTVRVAQKGREAQAALSRLKKTAPTFLIRAKDALQDGQFTEALESIDFAIDLEPVNADYHAMRGNVLQVLLRWPEAVESYQTALRLGDPERAKQNLALTESLIAASASKGDSNAKGMLFEALNQQGRQYEAMAFGSTLGDFWKNRNKDLSVLPELLRRLEERLLPVPGTDVLMSKTEFTVGEWKLYVRAEGLPEWSQPGKDWSQDDEHPVVNLNWDRVKKLCDWLSSNTGREWRLPTNAEWEAAVGDLVYPWGDHFPPRWDDGNYSILENGKEDPKKIGVDLIYGTAPVGSFKPNALGLYDLGGNALEWMWDGLDPKTSFRIVRGGGWSATGQSAEMSFRWSCRSVAYDNVGFRLVLNKSQ